MSDTLITASWAHIFSGDKSEWIKNDSCGNTVEYSACVFKVSAEASGVDAGESWYQFMKLAASWILKHITKPDLITNKVRQKRYLKLKMTNRAEILRQLWSSVQVNLHPEFLAV